MKKVLILHTSVGLGHKSIAENIGYYLSEAGFEVRLADIGKVQKGKFEKIVVGIHQFINKRLPFVWGWLYRWGHYIILPFRTFIAGFNYKLAKSYIDDFHPDLIISTQTTASAVVAYLKKQKLYNGKFGIAFSDFHLHKYWLYKEADFYLANTEEQKRQMMALGIPSEKIFVCGITLKPQIKVDPLSVKQKLGIQPTEKVVLVGTGSLGLGFKEKDLEELSKLQNTKIIFVCGKNAELYQKIIRLRPNFAKASSGKQGYGGQESLNYNNVIPLKFYQPMDELYAIADIFVGKPGGLSTAESLRWNLPLVVCYTLPGQEEKNLKYLEKHKLVIVKPKHLILAVSAELETGKFRESLKQNTERLKVFQEGAVPVLAVKTVLEGLI
jgi:processive 1,2-diacylglycerol beta-glucosyltransferase